MAVIPAAGLSRRMGRFKPLLRFGSATLLEHVVGGISPCVPSIVVVSGHQRDALEPVAREAGAECVFNPNFESGGMLSSIQSALAHLQGKCDAVLLALVDQPLVSPATIERLIEAWKTNRAPMVYPAFLHQRGHPVMIDASGFDEILSYDGEQTLKTFRMRHAGRVMQIDVDDPAILYDLDTPEDYHRGLQLLLDRSISCS